MHRLTLLLLATLLFSCAGDKSSETADSQTEKKEYSPYVGNYTPKPLPKDLDRPLFGDTHLHTSWSVDAGMLGTTLGTEEAYRESRGEEVGITCRTPIKISTSLFTLPEIAMK